MDVVPAPDVVVIEEVKEQQQEVVKQPEQEEVEQKDKAEEEKNVDESTIIVTVEKMATEGILYI